MAEDPKTRQKRMVGEGSAYFDKVDGIYRCAYHGDPLVDGGECVTCDEEDEAMMGGEEAADG